VNATIPIQAAETAHGWVLYDGDCPICTRSVQRFAEVLRRRGFDLAPLQTAWVREQFDLAANVPPKEMIVITPEQKVFGGADGIVQVARQIWWAWPLFALAQIPGVMILLRAIYRRVAANRY
jgi:predicted DCC family thiol-disulfide oxidoreductase YuxK